MTNIDDGDAEMSEVGTQLRAVRDLIAEPARWTTGEYARDANGKGVKSSDKNAVCHCLKGAVIKVVERETWHVFDMLKLVKAEVFPRNEELVVINDTLGHAAVLRLLDAAIERAEGGV